MAPVTSCSLHSTGHVLGETGGTNIPEEAALGYIFILYPRTLLNVLDTVIFHSLFQSSCPAIQLNKAVEPMSNKYKLSPNFKKSRSNILEALQSETCQKREILKNSFANG